MAKQGKHSGAHFAQKPAPSGNAPTKSASTKTSLDEKPLASDGQPAAQPAAQQYIGFTPQYQPHQHGLVRRKRSKVPIAIILLVILAALGAGGFMLWRHRPVSITVGGQQRTVMRRSTYNQLFASESAHVTPGNLVSVTGNVLEEGKGNPFTATVDGTPLSFDEVNNAPIWGGEKIEFGNGDDVLEPHTTEVVDLPPKLEFRAAPGTPEKGYMVQQGIVQYVTQRGKSGKQESLHGQTTGETGQGKVVEEAQNVVVVAQDIHPDGDKKLVALTFDDGPSYFTFDYLKILSDNDVKASFCAIGEQLEDGGPVVAQTHEAGHQILSHSWSHLQLTTLDEGQIAHELGDTAAKLEECVGAPVRFIRPPYGDLDEQVWLKSHGAINASVYWTHDSLDWEKPGVDAIVDNCTKFMKPGSVILMHDGGGDRSQDVEALPRIIKAWKDAGYTFVTVEELMASDSSIDLSVVKAGPMPADAAWPTEVAPASEG